MDPTRTSEIHRLVKKTVKPATSRSMMLEKENVADKFCFSYFRTDVISIKKCPDKSLGKLFDSRLRLCSSAEARQRFKTWRTEGNNNTSKHHHAPKKAITFVRAGE